MVAPSITISGPTGDLEEMIFPRPRKPEVIVGSPFLAGELVLLETIFSPGLFSAFYVSVVYYTILFVLSFGFNYGIARFQRRGTVGVRGGDLYGLRSRYENWGDLV